MTRQNLVSTKSRFLSHSHIFNFTRLKINIGWYFANIKECKQQALKYYIKGGDLIRINYNIRLHPLLILRKEVIYGTKILYRRRT